MVRRWILRGVMLAMLVLCIGAWAGSYWRRIGILYGADSEFRLNADWGTLRFEHREFPLYSDGFYITTSEPQFHPGQARAREFFDSFIGFAYSSKHFGWVGVALAFPLWLPALLLAGLSWFAWRKTRPRRKGRAFPVQTARRE